MVSTTSGTSGKQMVRVEEETSSVGLPTAAVVKTEVDDVASLTLSTPTPELRRSSRKRKTTVFKEEDSEEGIAQHLTPSKYWSAGKRTRRVTKKQESDDETLPTTPVKQIHKKKTIRKARVSSPGKKIKREYAPPEAYAHLDVLQDYLQEHLDVMFCGINPGCKSSETGHHFAHATNHFWRALHLSGFTDRLLKPAEDSTLPGSYNVGLTNLVERPSAEQAELSLADMQNGVPGLLAKIALHQPRVVCFVGKQIGEVFLKQACGAPRGTKFGMGFQGCKVVHTQGGVRETLFFIMPSSSARVTGYQLKDKADILKTLYDEVQLLKAGSGMSTEDMRVIPLPTISQET